MNKTIEIKVLYEGYTLAVGIRESAIENAHSLLREVAREVLQMRTANFIREYDVTAFLTEAAREKEE